MTIYDYYDTIQKWISSCETADQLSVCNEVIDKVFVDRFKASEDIKLIHELVKDLTSSIALQAKDFINP